MDNSSIRGDVNIIALPSGPDILDHFFIENSGLIGLRIEFYILGLVQLSARARALP